MRGGWRSTLSCVVLAAGLGGLAGLAGCGKVGGAGRPATRVAASATPSVAVPQVGACHNTTDTSARKVYTSGLTTVACGEPHVLETVHVGRFGADVAARQSLPPPDGPDARAAFADCGAKAKEYLGDEWFTGRLYLVFSRATAEEWANGARHYRCDLAEVTRVENQEMARRTASVRDGLRGARPLASTCYDYVNETADTYEDLTPVDCAGPHDVEFAGVFTATGDTPPAGTDAQDTAGHAGCDKVVAGYVGGTPEGMQVATLYWGFQATDWARGDKRVRCFAAKPADRKLKGSVKGIGNGRPPSA